MVLQQDSIWPIYTINHRSIAEIRVNFQNTRDDENILWKKNRKKIERVSRNGQKPCKKAVTSWGAESKDQTQNTQLSWGQRMGSDVLEFSALHAIYIRLVTRHWRPYEYPAVASLMPKNFVLCPPPFTWFKKRKRAAGNKYGIISKAFFDASKVNWPITM